MGNHHGKESEEEKLGGTGQLSTRNFHKVYMLGRDLGTGAFSVVKLGVDKHTGHKVAVKIVNRKKLSEEDLQSLAMEIKILDSLSHPHIIKLIEVFDVHDELYIVTELVEGGELFDRIVSKSHYTEKEARDLIKIFLETMSYMHDSNVVHRDLKPENLLLTSEDDDTNVKIADFGFAKRITDLKPDETACGTPGYVAPEILRGDQYGPEVDIWSMGVICYVLLAGYPPFYDEDQKKLFKKIKEGRYYFHEDYWGNVSADAMDLIRKMLCVHQQQRWTAKQLLNHPWIRSGDDELASRNISNALVEMKKFNARRRFKSAADAVILTNRMSKLMFGSQIGNGEGKKSEKSEDADEKSEEKVEMKLRDDNVKHP